MIIIIFFIICFNARLIYLTNNYIKTKKLIGTEKMKTYLITTYFGISMSLFALFALINASISVIIFIQMMLIFCISSIKKKKNLYVITDLILISIVGIILSIYYILNWNFNNIVLYIILGIGVYILPALGYIERKINIGNKMKRCTKEVEAKIIKVIKSAEHSGSTLATTIYIPKFEIELDGKKYEFMDSDEIYSRRKFKVGQIMKLFINPNNPQFDMYNVSDDVFLPDPEKEHNFFIDIVIWYILTTSIIIIFTLLRLFEI